jgi:uncharacterized protein (TIGR03083 family)
MDDAELWGAVRDERHALLADLERLSPSQWEAQSLCTEWKVRDVVAHLVEGAEARTGAILLALLRSGFRINHMIRDEALRRSRGETPDALLAAYRNTVGSHRVPPGTRPWMMLSDTIVHGQDIRRAVGLRRAFPAERLAIVLDGVAPTNPVIHTKRRVAGLRLRATDLDWTHGDGPEIHGPGEALLMAIMGRRLALSELGGEGLAMLSERVPATA